jgi:hypothetical protein
LPDVYVGVDGFVQFDPVEREANGKPVVDATVKPMGKTDNSSNVRLTIWPEFDVSLKKGDFVAAEGKFTKSTYQGQDGSQKQSNQISVTRLFVNGELIERKDREVESDGQPGGELF